MFHIINIMLTEREIDTIVSPEDEASILSIAKSPSRKNDLICSFAPDIKGYEEIKWSILLQLVKGVKKRRKNGSPTRDFFHILLIGDPGTAKSQFLLSVVDIAPKVRKIDGSGSSKAGLTATVVKDEFTGEWEFEAGALPMANKGILCLDESDKMNSEDKGGLHEPMEHGTVTITKAGINATMPAETSILAACNPKYGRFDHKEVYINQVNLPPAIFSRFDLIFAIKDIPAEAKDAALAEHILNRHRPDRDEVFATPIDSVLLRKYLAYAIKHIVPVLTEEAHQVLKEYYVRLRCRSKSKVEGEGGAVSITARQLEGLIRLSEAAAKLRLSSKVEEEDAREAIFLTDYFMTQLGTDPDTGKIDIDRITSGISSSTRDCLKTVLNIIKDAEGIGITPIPIEDILREAEKKDISPEKVDEVLEKLKNQREIFEPRFGFIQVLR